MTGTGLCDTPALRAQNDAYQNAQKDANSFSYAAYRGDLEELEKLYNEHSVNIVNAKNSGGINALMWASKTGRLDVAEFLLERGADLGVRDPEGFTLIERAQQSKKTEMVEFLTNWPRRLEMKEAAAAEEKRLALQIAEGREAKIALLKKKKPKTVFVTKPSLK